MATAHLLATATPLPPLHSACTLLLLLSLSQHLDALTGSFKETQQQELLHLHFRLLVRSFNSIKNAVKSQKVHQNLCFALTKIEKNVTSYSMKQKKAKILTFKKPETANLWNFV